MMAVRQLPLASRQTVTLALEGLTTKEIADFLGLTTNAVAIRLSRAKDHLRNVLGDTP
jgi:DNA-directed RNA polymerase specialized sigma24 family protein